MGLLLLRRLLSFVIPALLLVSAMGVLATRITEPLEGPGRYRVNQERMIRQVALGYDPVLVQAMASNWCWRF